ncbi:hypothetical protein EDB85DRAFT_2148231 [Lactarius pseudohatsudake]|nr:hypothetical protein EDB85DRAFT_2148231 [Lactarius pseudohatsudake]
MEPSETWLLLVDHNFRAIGGSFSVDTIPGDDNINKLKEKAKVERQIDLARVDAANLTVWKTKDTIDESNFERFAKGIDVNDKDAIEKLSVRTRVADLGLSDSQTLLVRMPGRQLETVIKEERAHMRAIEMANNAPAPSSVARHPLEFNIEQDRHPIYNGRPADKRGPPVTIYHKVFAELKDALRDLTKVVDRAEEKRVDDTAQLFTAATDIYETEAERFDAIVPHLENLLGIVFVTKPRFRSSKKDFEPDAIVAQAINDETHGRKEAIIGHVEFENDCGVRGDCEIRNALKIRKHLAQEEEIRNASCCPCITVSIAGPYINIGGAILVDVFTVESFTGYIYLGGNPYAEESILHMARVFAAVSQAFLDLKRFYQDLKLGRTPQLCRLFPSPTYFADKMPQTKLTFSSRFEPEGRESSNYQQSLFRATYVAAAHYAPELFFCERIQGGVTMVIMKFIAGQNAHYHRFQDRELPPDILDDVKSAVRVLHDAGIVFGDLRRPNIVIDTTGDRDRALLVDFEWAGHDGKARYPALLNNTGQITWATGVKRHGIMRKEHDIEMIEYLNTYQ